MSVISILIIIMTMGFTMINKIKIIKEKIVIENVVYEFREMLSYGKYYSKKNNIQCAIYIDERDFSVTLRIDEVDNKLLRKIEPSKDIIITSNLKENEISKKKISIKENGFIFTAGTINIKNKNKEEYKITIAVGTDIISIEGPIMSEGKI